MWDTRSIIVRFRRQRGNTCLPGEPKPNVKKIKEEPKPNVKKVKDEFKKVKEEFKKVRDELNNAAQVKKEQKANHVEPKSGVKKEDGNQGKEDKVKHTDKPSTNQETNVETRLQDNFNKAQNSKPASQVPEQNTNSHSTMLPTSITSAKTVQEQQQQPWVWIPVLKKKSDY